MAIEEQIYGLNQSQLQEPWYLDMLQNMPRAWETTGWNIGRVSRTMISPRARTVLPRLNQSMEYRGYGRVSRGFGLGRRELSGVGSIRQGIYQTTSFRRLGRLSRAANIDPTAYGPKAGIYSPFNFLSSTGNFLFKKRDAARIPLLGERVNQLVGKGSGMLSGRLGLAAGDVPFSPGTLGRIAGMSKIVGMSDNAFMRRSGNMLSAIKDINPAFQVPTSLGSDAMIARKFAMGAEFGNTITGRVSGRAAGYMYGAQAARMNMVDVVANKAKGVFAEGVAEGSKAFVQGSRFAKVASYGGGILRGVNLAANIMLIHDAALLMGKAVGGVLKTGAEAFGSIQGSINKPLMGMGFKDNTIAASSRARGVMAIQNSQLNARSTLGSEASMLAAHFG